MVSDMLAGLLYHSDLFKSLALPIGAAFVGLILTALTAALEAREANVGFWDNFCEQLTEMTAYLCLTWGLMMGPVIFAASIFQSCIRSDFLLKAGFTTIWPLVRECGSSDKVLAIEGVMSGIGRSQGWVYCSIIGLTAPLCKMLTTAINYKRLRHDPAINDLALIGHLVGGFIGLGLWAQFMSLTLAVVWLTSGFWAPVALLVGTVGVTGLATKSVVQSKMRSS